MQHQDTLFTEFAKIGRVPWKSEPERSIERSRDRATDRATERSSDRATERPSDRSSDQATERSSDREQVITQAPDGLLTC